MIFPPAIDNFAAISGACVTIGNFDGVHLGHQYLISQTMQIAKEKSLECIVITFWPHPRMALNKGSHYALSTQEQRHMLLQMLGIRHIIEIPFTQKFSSVTAREFVQDWLLPLKIRHLVIGHDFSFGKNREGNFDFLQKYSRNFYVTQAKPLKINGNIISSSFLRQIIAKGEIEHASKLLGRFYSISGIVEHGFGRGKEMGFPTANLLTANMLLPAKGVYATLAECEGKKYPAVTNIGINPTFGNKKLTVESFLLDADINLYGKNLTIYFVKHLRNEKKFQSASELKCQIQQDVTQAKQILDSAIQS